MNEKALKWAEALESGEFKQTKGVLTRIDRNGEQSHCCFGVLCILAIRDGVEVDTEVTSGTEITGNGIAYDDQITMPPKSVKDWFGWYSISSYATMNDTGWMFDVIAARIRKDFKLPSRDGDKD